MEENWSPFFPILDQTSYIYWPKNDFNFHQDSENAIYFNLL